MDELKFKILSCYLYRESSGTSGRQADTRGGGRKGGAVDGDDDNPESLNNDFKQ